MKMTSAKKERHHVPAHENLQPAIYNGQLCPTSKIQGRRRVCQEQHHHGQKTQALSSLWLSWGMDQVNIRREKRQVC